MNRSPAGDALWSFCEMYLKECGTYTLRWTTKLLLIVHFEGDHNNNKMKGLNGEYRDREKTIRGVKKMDSAALKGYQFYHNYFREHEGLVGKTPAEVAGIKIEGNNKWMTVIQNASLKNTN